jgi:hypothetical protein
MRGLALIGVLLALTTGMARAAAVSFQDKELDIKLQVPDGFTKPDALLPFPDELGPVKALYADLEHPQSAAFTLIHRMELPAGMEFKNLQTGLEAILKEQLGASLKFLSQQEVKAGKREGFLLDFEAPDNGRMPEANGTIRHHVRWYVLKDDPTHVIGIVYHSVEDAWKELEPKYTASFKSVAPAE